MTVTRHSVTYRTYRQDLVWVASAVTVGERSAETGPNGRITSRIRSPHLNATRVPFLWYSLTEILRMGEKGQGPDAVLTRDLPIPTTSWIRHTPNTSYALLLFTRSLGAERSYSRQALTKWGLAF